MSIKKENNNDIITEDITKDIIEKLKQRIRRENPNGVLKRDTHSKMYGVVRAEFTVEPHLAKELAIGIFAQPQTFQAWIRFSNQNTLIQDDYQPDIRGMAIKLMNVPGPKLIEPLAEISTHDFVLISPPRFIAKNLKEFDAMLSALQGNIWQKLLFFGSHIKLVWILLRSMIRIANPLQIPYFSTTAYALGNSAVKYSCRPTSTQKDGMPQRGNPDYLRSAMVKQLASSDVYFDFCIQLQSDAIKMPIENPQKIWSEAQSPFRKVASIRILQQEFDDEAHHCFGENLSFNPWRVIEEHKPLGEINRARLSIYQAIAAFRRNNNHNTQPEPHNWDIQQ